MQRLKQLSSAQQNATGHQPKAEASIEYFHILEIFYYNFTMAYSLERFNWFLCTITDKISVPQ